MAITEKQIERLVSLVFEELKSHNVVTFKKKEDAVFGDAIELVRQELYKEKQLDQDVNKMMDDLERQNPGSFQRYKMFPLLKKRLAKEKGIIL